ncbi:MAG TPA: protein kinase, partial [Kofleriaceae bacterium]|nr:protein kinase [Kofleriaceae bacterium]
VLLPELAGSQVLQRRFFEEARAAAEIHDPRIVEVLDLARLPSGRCYIMMEYLHGESLEHMHRRLGRLDQAQAVAVVEQVLLGLCAAHEHGIVHRDLKPANLFVVDAGEAPPRMKILDFGVAKLRPRPGSEGFTQSGAVIGTPGYMAPEQAGGRSREVDARADVYAMGVVLYVLLSGRRPFDSPDWVERLLQQRTAAPPPLENVDPALERAVMRALELEPAARFESAAAMRKALLEAIGGEPALVPIPSPAPGHPDVPHVASTIETGSSLKRKGSARARVTEDLAGMIETGSSQHVAAARLAEDAPRTARESPSAKREPAAPGRRAVPRWLVPGAALASAAIAAVVGAALLSRDSAAPQSSAGAADAANAPEPPSALSATTPDAAVAVASRSPPPDAAPPRVERARPSTARPRSQVKIASVPVEPDAPDTQTATVGPEPKPVRGTLSLKVGERRTFRGELRPGALRQVFPFSTDPGAVLRLHLASPDVEAIDVDLWGCASAHQKRRLSRSEWDGCADCEVFIDATTDRSACEIRVTATMPGTFRVTVHRRN